MATSDRTMTDLYRALAPTERVRLVARLVSAGNLGELRRVRDALPPAPDTHRAAYSRALQGRGQGRMGRPPKPLPAGYQTPGPGRPRKPAVRPTKPTRRQDTGDEQV